MQQNKSITLLLVVALLWAIAAFWTAVFLDNLPMANLMGFVATISGIILFVHLVMTIKELQDKR
jgi:hypothetical protein